jgi:hypothetical protein
MKNAIVSGILLIEIILGSSSGFSQATSSATSTVTFAVNRSSQSLVKNYENGSGIQTSAISAETGVFVSPAASRPFIITASFSQPKTGNMNRYQYTQCSSAYRTVFIQSCDKNIFPILSKSDSLSLIRHKSEGNPIIITVTD